MEKDQNLFIGFAAVISVEEVVFRIIEMDICNCEIFLMVKVVESKDLLLKFMSFGI